MKTSLKVSLALGAATLVLGTMVPHVSAEAKKKSAKKVNVGRPDTGNGMGNTP
jgi:hypothetical protein